MNLLRETEQVLEDHGHTWDEVTFIGSCDGKYGVTVDHFKRIADVEYDNGFGAAEVPTELVITLRCGANLTRHEYDGSESWEYMPVVKPAPDCQWNVHETLVGELWPTMGELLRSEES